VSTATLSGCDLDTRTRLFHHMVCMERRRLMHEELNRPVPLNISALSCPWLI
jgi:hypothetical protein